MATKLNIDSIIEEAKKTESVQDPEIIAEIEKIKKIIDGSENILDSKERHFVFSMTSRMRKGQEITKKQEAWLGSLLLKCLKAKPITTN
jgi:hypothetical protein